MNFCIYGKPSLTSPIFLTAVSATAAAGQQSRGANPDFFSPKTTPDEGFPAWKSLVGGSFWAVLGEGK